MGFAPCPFRSAASLEETCLHGSDPRMLWFGLVERDILWFGWRGRIRTFDLVIQRTPNDFADRWCGLRVARTGTRSIRRAIRLSMPDGVR